MRRVVQEDENGCGVACVAMLAGVNYQAARVKMFPRRGGYTNTADLRRALRKFKLKCAPRMVTFRSSGFRNYKDLPTDAILKLIAPTHPPGVWHWVVWDARRKCLLDPRKRPYRRFRITSYLAVG